MATDGFVFDAELLLHSNGQQFVQQVRAIFAELRAESQRAIAGGSQAGISGIQPAYTSALGQVAAIAANKPLLTETQQGNIAGALRGAERSYVALQRRAEAAGLQLGDLSPAGLKESYVKGRQLLDQALQRQSNEILRAAAEAERLAAAERKAASEADASAKLAAARTAAGAPTSRPQSDLRVPAAQQQGLIQFLSGGATGRNEIATALRTQALEVRAATARDQATNVEYLKAKAQATLAERERAIAVARVTREEAIAAGQGGGTFFQRLQAQIHSRSSQTDVRLPSDFQTAGQFFESKALTTIGFGLSAGVIYGAVSGFKEIIRESSELQRQLAIIKGQFDTLGDSRGFDDFARKIVDISVQTGVAADQVALVARQLAGVFRVEGTGLPDFNRALSETQQALKLSQVTGLPLQEITDSLTALTVTFGDSFTKIGDLAIGLEQRFGVLAPQIIEFAADVAPVAKELGLTLEQISGLGAIAQQRSGIAGSALAESFNRALPAIQQSQVQIAQLLGQRAPTEQFITPLLTAITQSRGADVIKELISAYQQMTEVQRQAFGELLGGQRNAKAFFDILQGGQDTIDALDGKTGNFTGSLDRRFRDFQSTVEFAFERARRAFEQFGLALFNSGIADGLKFIADNGALLVTIVGDLLKVFSGLNDALGGIPIKLLAVYATLRLISSLTGGIAGVRTLIAGIGSRGAAPGANPIGFAPSGAAAAEGGAAQAFRFGIPLGSYGQNAGPLVTGASGLIANLGPAIIATSIAGVVQTVQQLNAESAAARKGLQDRVRDGLAKGLTPEAILAEVKRTGGDQSAGLTFAGVNLPFGQTTGTDISLETIRRQFAERQGKELSAIIKNADEGQRKKIAQLFLDNPDNAAVLQNLISDGTGTTDVVERLAAPGQLEQVIDVFLKDPTRTSLNDAVVKVIGFIASGGGTPEQMKQLAEIASQYAKQIQGAASAQAVNDYAPTLEEVRANYDLGNASLSEVVAVEKHNIELLRTTVAATTGAARAQAATQLASAQKQLDSDLTTAAQRASDLATKLASFRGESGTQATLDAALATLQSLTSQGASPDAQLDASLSVLDALQKQLDEFVNSPVIINGIARAPTAAEKLARAAQGIKIPDGVREALIKAELQTGKNAGLAAKVAAGTGDDISTIIDDVARIATESDHTLVDALLATINSKIANLQRELANLEPSDAGIRAGVQAALAALQQARSALGSLAANAPAAGEGIGSRVTRDTTDLSNQATIDATNEAKALADALISQQRARAHGDQIATAEAAIASAQNALRYATKPSERAAAIAQLIEAQNQLEDAQHAAVDSYIALGEALSSDPVLKAQYELNRANNAVANAHGAQQQYEALARQAEAQRTLHEAIVDVFRSQQELVAAIADAAGDTVGAARAQLDIAQQNLEELLARQRAGDNPGDAAINRAKAQVVQSQAAVRDADLRKREQDIDIALQLERITTAQAIAQFQALLQIPKLTADETNEILLKIKQLQGQLNQDLKFDIPNDLKLPTLYEVRRLIGNTSTPAGPGTYQDNRQISLTLNAASQVDLQPAVDQLVAVIAGPRRNGPRVGAY